MSKVKNKKEIMVFNSDGMIEFRNFLNSSRGQKRKDFSIPLDYLTDPNLIKPLSVPRYIDLDKAKSFDSRFDLAKYLYNLLNQTLTEQEIYGQGLWEWLTLFYFEMFALGSKGWVLNRYDHYIYLPSSAKAKKYNHSVSPNWNVKNPTGIRHCVRGSYFAYQYFKENAQFVLEAPSGPAFRGDIAEGILARRWIKDYPFIVEVMHKVALNADGSVKTVWGKNPTGYLEPGSQRSFIARVENFVYSHNFNLLDSKDLRRLIGAEFT
jgi:hypothetical protein